MLTFLFVFDFLGAAFLAGAFLAAALGADFLAGFFFCAIVVYCVLCFVFTESTRLELATPAVTGRCSDQLSYDSRLSGIDGFCPRFCSITKRNVRDTQTHLRP